jgi:hypothetical protein
MTMPSLTGWNAAALVTTGASIPMVDQSPGCPATPWNGSWTTVKVVAMPVQPGIATGFAATCEATPIPHAIAT